MRKRTIDTGKTGSLELERTYLVCVNPNCDYTDFPLDRLLALSHNRASGKYEEKICWLSAHAPFEYVKEYFKNLEGLDVDEEMIRNVSENCGYALLKKEEEPEEIERNPIFTTRRLYTEIDGAMVPIRGKQGEKDIVEYKENKLTLLFREEDIKYNKKGTKRNITSKQYVTSLGQGVDHFEMLTKKKCDLYKAEEIVYLTDGAEWIDQMRLRLHPHSIHILDWYHAEEHLWDCGKSLFGDKEELKIKNFVIPLKELLWNGKVLEVCANLLNLIKEHPKKETEIRNLYSYYHTRQSKMQYDKFRAQGYFIGSGAVESANKYLVQQRLKQAGMKWTIKGAHSILKLREKIYEGSWALVWKNKHANFSY